jgi:serine protease Do
VRVTQVVPSGAAATAGLKEGDVIVSVNGQAGIGVFYANGLRTMYGGKPAGTPIPVSIKRGEETLNVQVPLRYGAAAPRIVEDASASPRAVRLRNGLLHGTTTPK